MPTTPADAVDRTLEELNLQDDAAAALRTLPPEALLWRPGPKRWSIAQQLEHLTLTNRPYMQVLEEAIRDSRSRDRAAAGPYRRGFFGNWLAGTMKPPVKMKVRTTNSLVPDAELDTTEVFREFRDTQESLRAVVEEARGVDLGRTRFRSPILPLVRLDLGVGFDLIVNPAYRKAAAATLASIHPRRTGATSRHPSVHGATSSKCPAPGMTRSSTGCPAAAARSR